MEVFKILNAYENIDRVIFSRSRKIIEHEVKDRCRLYIMMYSFSQRTASECNIISTDCETVSSLNMFKNKVDTFLRRADYTNLKKIGLLIRR